MEDPNAYYGLMSRKLTYLKEMLTATEVANITPDEQGGLRYVSLMQERDEIFQQILKVDAEINDMVLRDEVISGNAAGHKDVKPLKKEITNITRRIVSLDQANEAAVSKIMSEIKGNLKDVKVGKNVNNAYAPVFSTGSGYYFDTKN